MDAPRQEDQYAPADLREYLAVIKTRKWSIVLVLLLVLGLTAAYSLQQDPVYTAEARLLVKPIPSIAYYPSPSLQTETELVGSRPIAERAAEIVDADPDALLDGLSVSPVLESQVLRISYSAGEAQEAADAANAFAQGFIDYQDQQANRDLQSRTQAVTDEIESVEKELSAVLRSIDRATARNDSTLLSRLRVEETALSTRLGVLQQQLDEVGEPGAEAEEAGEIIEPASPPSQPSSPNHVTNGILGLLIGLALGLAVAFLRDRLDDRFRGRGDVEKVVEAPVMSTIPKINGKRGEDRLVVLTEPQGGAAEAYRVLRTNIMFLAGQKGLKVFAITSPREGEGKTLTAANLAAALGQTNKKVALVSADLRRPTLASYLRVDVGDWGLSSWLTGVDDELPPLVLTRADNVDLLPAGPIPHNPAELLTSPALPRLVAQLRERYDYVIFDTPPVLPIADVSVLAPSIDGTLLVLDSTSTRRSQARHAREDLQRVGASLVGAVLNNLDPGDSTYYQYTPRPYAAAETSTNGRHSRSTRRRRLRGRR